MTALLPLSLFLAASLLFTFALHFPYRTRLLLFPYIYLLTLASLFTAPHLDAFPVLPDFWAFGQLIWTHHAAAMLLIEPVSLPQGQEKWVFARKVWLDVRRVTDWNALRDSQGKAREGKAVAVFVLARTAKLGAYYAAYAYLLPSVSPALAYRVGISSADFAPAKTVFVRRVLFGGDAVTRREVCIRAFMAAEWIVTGMRALDAWNATMALFFVAVLRWDEPAEWPLPFGSILDAYTVRRFWGQFWHSLVTPSALASGRFVAGILRLPRKSATEKCFLAFWVFLVSGTNHAVVGYALTGSTHAAHHLGFFLLNFAAVTAEVVVAPRVLGRPLEQCLRGSMARRLLGYVWVFGFFFWATPKWKYGMMYEAVKGVEEASRASARFQPWKGG